jgi:hypothetical protein
LGQAGTGVLSDPWPLCLSHHFFVILTLLTGETLNRNTIFSQVKSSDSVKLIVTIDNILQWHSLINNCMFSTDQRWSLDNNTIYRI